MERTKTIEELPKQLGNATVEVKPENLSFQQLIEMNDKYKQEITLLQNQIKMQKYQK